MFFVCEYKMCTEFRQNIASNANASNQYGAMHFLWCDAFKIALNCFVELFCKYVKDIHFVCILDGKIIHIWDSIAIALKFATIIIII